MALGGGGLIAAALAERVPTSRLGGFPNNLGVEPSTELYDHDRDAEELHDVASENPEIVKELLMQLQSIGRPQL